MKKLRCENCKTTYNIPLYDVELWEIDVEGDTLCPDCREAEAAPCDTCGDWYYTEHLDDDRLCNDCR